MGPDRAGPSAEHEETMIHPRDCVTRLLNRAVADRVFPGAVWAVGNARNLLDVGTCGLADPTDPTATMRASTIFDLASLTKIVAVWAVIGSLWEEQVLPLDEPLAAFWPDVATHPVGRVTSRHLLAHTAGLPLRANLRPSYGTDPGAIRTGILHAALRRPPGQAVEYTDRAALILGYLTEHLTDTPLDRLARSRIWLPLGMTHTRFGPLPAPLAQRCAPTEYDPGTAAHLKGSAHDYSARALGGVCGSAGVFSVVSDLARFQQYLLAPAASPIGFGESWVAESLRIQTGNLSPSRGLFWHLVPDTGSRKDIYVHHGFTGTSMWLSPSQERWAVLLTNKIYFTRSSESMIAIRKAYRRLVFGSPTRSLA
ncbi:serine hydrolase domain-containing protein [Nonomuraea sp. NPDC023979]|uniref:serine hydrolase domain-containing protein n=1 Tax=Nonomuraea sp. NPDC023979 TaxID=3154796 RepID=UPI0033E39909